MRFETVPVEKAEGAILAHSVLLPEISFKKGRKLSASNVAALASHGARDVMVARLEQGDVTEDDAAGRVARAVAGPHTTVGEPFTGRANLYAATSGLASLNAAGVIALNSLDEGLTVATVSPYERVATRQMLATVKVIPFALPESVVAQAESLARGTSATIGVAPFRQATAGLILTRLAGTKPSILEKRRQAVEARLSAAGSRLGPVEVCDHDIARLTLAIAAMHAMGADPVLVFGASAIVDRGDVIPAAVAAAGGEVVHLGMPVDPGNLLMLGKLGSTDVIGVPSCAASPKVNGFDWILQRRLAGLPVGRPEIIAMAPGGLLKEIVTRPQPRESDVPGMQRSEPRIGAIVLAAGRSTRMGPRNKLLEDVGGMAMVRRVAMSALGSRARPVLVVTGHQSQEVAAAMAGLDVTFTHNARYADGLGVSLAAGIAALPAGLDGVLVALGDMPGVTAAHLDRLIAAFDPKDGRAICIATHAGRRGNPVLLAAVFFQELLSLTGDNGARGLIGLHQDVVAEVEIASDAVLVDVDTPEALSKMREKGSGIG